MEEPYCSLLTTTLMPCRTGRGKDVRIGGAIIYQFVLKGLSHLKLFQHIVRPLLTQKGQKWAIVTIFENHFPKKSVRVRLHFLVV